MVHPVTRWDVPGFVFAPYAIGKNERIRLHPDQFYSATYDTGSQEITKAEFPEDLGPRDFHVKLVEKGVEAIQNGTLQKVVLARSIEVPLAQSAFGVFENLLQGYPAAFCYLFFHPVTGMWAGASPELLLSHRETTAQTMSLAGTLKAKGPEPPHWSPKEIWEQQVVTDYICSQLKEQGLVPESGIATGVRAGTLWHLRTPITVQVTKKRIDAVIDALHPTPAVCGLPLAAARDFIAEYEQLNRRYYTGFLGPIGLTGQENLELYVNLRCAALGPTQATLYVGGGITSGSLPEVEYEETKQKAVTMWSALNNSPE